MRFPVNITLAEAVVCANEWGANCGPGALAGVLGMTLCEVRPHMKGFEEKGYTNPTLMWSSLKSIGIAFSVDRRRAFPEFGLARVQWEGPWTRPGVPPRAAYRHTHWIGVGKAEGQQKIFDINAICVGGWIPREEWSNRLVPWLLSECEPKSTGGWFVTHCVELMP